MSARALVDWTLKESGWGDIEALEREHWIDCQPDFDESHYIDGFTVPALAERLGRSVKSVEGLVTRARRELRVRLDDGADVDRKRGSGD